MPHAKMSLRSVFVDEVNHRSFRFTLRNIGNLYPRHRSGFPISEHLQESSHHLVPREIAGDAKDESVGMDGVAVERDQIIPADSPYRLKRTFPGTGMARAIQQL